MKRYSVESRYAVTEENGTPIKQCNVQLYLCEQGIDKHNVMDLLNGVMECYNRFLVGEAGEQDNRSIRKGWFNGF